MLQLRTTVRIDFTRVPFLLSGALLIASSLGLFLLEVHAEPSSKGPFVASLGPAGAPAWKPSVSAKGELASGALSSAATFPSASLPPLAKAQVMRILEIAEHGDGLHGQRFAKIGDSMTVSRSYLRCFAREGNGWDRFEGLREAVEHFRSGPGPSPFLRVSEAARVGWSVRSAIIGRPSPLRKELRALHPRFATVMFGTNDIESRSPRRFARRMWRLLEELESRGVVPIVSDILPQRRSGDQNHWVHRYNLIVRALTEGRSLPLVRLHDDFRRLPRLGLAGDGIHANAYRLEGQQRACDMTEAGLRFGHNLRNLRTLQHLGRAAKVLLGQPVPMVSSPRAEETQGPLALALPHASIETRDVAEGAKLYELELTQRSELRVMAIAKAGGPLQINVSGPNGYERSRRTDWVGVVPAGRYQISVVTVADADDAYVLTVEAPAVNRSPE